MFLLRVRAAPTAVLTTSRVNQAHVPSHDPARGSSSSAPTLQPPSGLNSVSGFTVTGDLLCPSVVCLLLPRGPHPACSAYNSHTQHLGYLLSRHLLHRQSPGFCHSPLGDLEKKGHLARQDTPRPLPSGDPQVHALSLRTIPQPCGQPAGPGQAGRRRPVKDNTGDSSTERAFQKLLELPVGSKTADSEAVKTVTSVTLLNRSQHEDAGGQKSSHFGLPWEVLFLLESPLCCLCELQPGLSPPRGPRQRRPGASCYLPLPGAHVGLGPVTCSPKRGSCCSRDDCEEGLESRLSGSVIWGSSQDGSGVWKPHVLLCFFPQQKPTLDDVGFGLTPWGCSDQGTLTVHFTAAVGPTSVGGVGRVAHLLRTHWNPGEKQLVL